MFYINNGEIINNDINTIMEYCEKFGIKKYNINDDYSVDVFDNVDLSNNKINGVIPIKFNEVHGDFKCSRCGLLNLNNTPKIIHKSFDVSHNYINDFKFSPQYIGGDLNANFNKKLFVLKQFPNYVGGSLYFEFCGLKSLYKMPAIVNGNCNIILNSNLKRIKYSPKRVYGNYNCSYCLIKSLMGGPLYVEGDFICNNNLLFNIKYSPRYIGGDFNFSDNCVKSFYGFPDYVGGDVICNNNDVFELWRLFKSVNDIEYFNRMKIIDDYGNLNLKKLNIFLTSIGKPKVEKLYNYDIL